MTDALSLEAAARDAGDHPAIVTAGQTLTFADCARAIASREIARGASGVEALVATPEIGTVLAIHAALAARRPLALFHPRLSPEEHTRQRTALATARLPEGTAVVLFTSGSTGASRGVVHGRAGLAAAAEASAAHLGWREGDRWLACLPLAHAGGLSIVIRCLAARRAVVLLEGAFDADGVLALARDARATLASFVPTQLAALVERVDARPGAALADLRAVLLGGAAAPPGLLDAARALGLPVRATYGLTETFGQVATARDATSPPVPLPGIEVSAGTAAAPAPIRVRGPALATCYLDGTPIAPELVTADLGFLDEAGALHVVGRADDVIVTGGENVHPAQVEAVLAATPGVRAACAFGVPDARWGQIVAAAIATDAAFDPTTALPHWHAALPAHARPRRLAATAALPLLPSGKIDRRAAASLPSQALDYRTPADRR